MAYLINLATFTDNRGNLTVIEEATIPFDIKRVFYIYGVDNVKRGGHRHKITLHAAICIQGSCSIYNHDGEKENTFLMDSPDKCLVLETKDWHTMQEFSSDAILMVLASAKFDTGDYIFEPYPQKIESE